MSFMRTGHASLFVDRILRFEARASKPQYGTWAAFRQAFIAEFCPRNKAQEALALLETTSYFQGSRAVDEYIDAFKDLIERAGYTDKTMVTMKFCRGLQGDIQDKVAQALIGDAGDVDPER
jgi:hypothetical protein